MLSGGFPVDLVVASPFESVKGDAELDEKIPFYDFRSQLDSTWTRLNSERIQQCVRDFSAAEIISPPACFAPAIEYQGHPDGTPINGEFADASLSVWSNFTPEKETCVASQLNYKLTQLRVISNLGMDGIKLMFCAANLLYGGNVVTLPFAAGDESDLTAEVNTLLEGQTIGGTIDSMTISRLPDVDLLEVYQSSFQMTRDDGSNIDAILRHIKTAQDNSLYKGKFSLRVTRADNSGVDGVSILYAKDLVDNMNLEVRHGVLPDGTERSAMFDEFDSLKAPLSGSTDSGYSWGLFSIDPLDGTGEFGFSWLNGASTNNIRSMVGELSKNETDGFNGCLFNGFGDSFDTVFADLSRATWLDRMICNPEGPGTDVAGQPLVQKQCMKQSPVSGVFEMTETNVAYIPRNSCGISSESNEGFSWRISGETTSFNAFPPSHSLISVGTLVDGELTVPSAPDEL